MSFKLISLCETYPDRDPRSFFLFDFEEFTGITNNNLLDMLTGTTVRPLDFIQYVEDCYYALTHLCQPTNNITSNMPWNYCCYLYYKNKIKPTIKFDADGYIICPSSNISYYTDNFSMYFRRKAKNSTKNSACRSKIREEREEFKHRLSPRQIIHRLANELLLFISDPALCNPHASQVSLENKSIVFNLSVPDMEGTDLGTFVVTYFPVNRFGKTLTNITGGNFNTNAYIHPHADGDGDVCLGNRTNAVSSVYTEGSLLFSLSTICAVLQTYNENSPYIELDDLVNGESYYCYTCGDHIDVGETYYTEGNDYCQECVGACDRCMDIKPADCLYSVNDGEITLCDPCITRFADTCISCGEYWITKELLERVGSSKHVLICPECIEEWDETHSEEEEEEEKKGEAPFHE